MDEEQLKSKLAEQAYELQDTAAQQRPPICGTPPRTCW